ncbi:MAG: aldo/keto reductase, partial [Candidatus Sumerlaeaceae bacterium]|nr:aldo/keto reductase [Candidatus Sumerlaeaceae bacterium]
DWAADVDPNPCHFIEAEAISFVHAALDRGVNFIDTAPAYWHSEEYLGKALKGYRDRVVLATKVGEHCDPSGSYYDYSYAASLGFIDQSLRRLQTDYLDLIQIHSAPLDVLERGETYEALCRARDEGKVLHIRMTGGARECARAIELGGYETVQVPYNLLNLLPERLVFPLVHRHQVGVLVMRGLAGGKLTEKYVNILDLNLKEKIASFEKFLNMSGISSMTHLALGYVLGSPDVSCVLVGTRKIEHLDKAIAAAWSPIAPALLEELRAHATALGLNVW